MFFLLAYAVDVFSPEFAAAVERDILIIVGHIKPMWIIVVNIPFMYVADLEGRTVVLDLVASASLGIVCFPGCGDCMESHDLCCE